jgi:AraC-like DNA-binding protein
MFDSIGIFQTDEKIGEELYIYECGFEDVKPRDPYQYEQLDYYLLHYVISGEGLFFINGDVHKLGAGDLFLVPPATENNYYPLIGNPWSYRWIGFKGTKSSSLLKECGFSNDKFTISYNKDETVVNLFEEIYNNSIKGRLHAALGHLYILFNGLMVAHENELRYSFSEAEKYVKWALDIIHDRFNQHGLSVASVADEINVDRTYLFKLFKAYVKYSPQAYIIHFRLNKACDLLRKSSFSVSEISQLTGFSTASHFSKLFTKHKGTSPVSYRRQFIKNIEK